MNQFEKKKEILKLQTVQRFVENATVEDEKGREKPLAKVVDIVFREASKFGKGKGIGMHCLITSPADFQDAVDTAIKNMSALYLYCK